MNRRSRPALGAAILVFWAVAAFQGWRILQLEQTEDFYRWIITTSDQVRVEGIVGDMPSAGWDVEVGSEEGQASPKEDVDERTALARELFNAVVQKTEPLLPDVSADAAAAAADDSAQPTSKLVSHVRDLKHLDVLWQLAHGDELAEERERFMNELRPKLDVGVMYSSEGNVSMANMFFGFRKMAANFVWLQVDQYWHEGALFRMVPLMRTTVILDPTFVDAYLLGAWHLAYNITVGLPETPEAEKKFDPDAGKRLGTKESFYFYAADFLKDGISNNPKDYRLYFDLGYRIYHEKLHDNEAAATYLKEAVRYRHDIWVPRTLYRILEYNGQYDEALRGWKDYLSRYPQNDVAPRFIARNEAHIVQRDALKAFAEADEARAAGRTADADALQQKGQALWDDARQKWAAMAQDDPTYANAQVQLMNAEELRKKGMYYDAIALLDGARFESGEMFMPISDKIVELKQEANIPLSLSERMELERREEAARYREAERELQKQSEAPAAAPEQE